MNERKNLKVHADVHQRLKIHADILRLEVGDLANTYLYEAMRIAERTNQALHWLTSWEPAYVEEEAKRPGKGRRGPEPQQAQAGSQPSSLATDSRPKVSPRRSRAPGARAGSAGKPARKTRT